MKTSRSKYFLSCIILLASIYLKAQENSGNNQNQAMIMVIGDPIQTTNSNDFINTNPYPQNSNPPPQQSLQDKTTIEPTLENGFHARFDLGSTKSVDKMSSAPYFPSEGNVGKTKKTFVSFTQFRFNTKKRIKAWLPKRAKRYRPHRCGRF